MLLALEWTGCSQGYCAAGCWLLGQGLGLQVNLLTWWLWLVAVWEGSKEDEGLGHCPLQESGQEGWVQRKSRLHPHISHHNSTLRGGENASLVGKLSPGPATICPLRP